MNSNKKCRDKKLFSTELEARKERLYVEKEYNKKFRIYNCSDCKGWHFSTIN
jgi:hypothetical protein